MQAIETAGGLDLRQGYQGPFLLGARGTGTKHAVLGASERQVGGWASRKPGVKEGEHMKCLGNGVWNETYISKGSEGRAGLGS